LIAVTDKTTALSNDNAKQTAFINTFKAQMTDDAVTYDAAKVTVVAYAPGTTDFADPVGPKGLSTGAIAGIAIGAAVLVVIVAMLAKSGCKESAKGCSSGCSNHADGSAKGDIGGYAKDVLPASASGIVVARQLDRELSSAS
jgi:hypothetical protein